jgi:hypothetical protein
MYTYIHMYINIYIYIFTHAHIHTKQHIDPSEVGPEYANAMQAEREAAQLKKPVLKTFYNSGLSKDREVPASSAELTSSWLGTWL